MLDPSQQTTLWRFFPRLSAACCQEPAEWPLLRGSLASRARGLMKPTLAPDLAFRLAKDSAIDAAKRSRTGSPHGPAIGGDRG